MLIELSKFNPRLSPSEFIKTKDGIKLPCCQNVVCYFYNSALVAPTNFLKLLQSLPQIVYMIDTKNRNDYESKYDFCAGTCHNAGTMRLRSIIDISTTDALNAIIDDSSTTPYFTIQVLGNEKSDLELFLANRIRKRLEAPLRRLQIEYEKLKEFE